ncbi:hypothetical protein BvCmsC51A_01936 [Escherichia coli]|nr:hypothetical protein BvCmsC51A_01936 [Escherichia coli]
MQAHTDRVAHNPTPPATPLLTEAIAFLWVYDAAICLTNTVTIGDQCPGEIEIFYFSTIRETELTQYISTEHPAGTADDKRCATQELL